MTVKRDIIQGLHLAVCLTPPEIVYFLSYLISLYIANTEVHLKTKQHLCLVNVQESRFRRLFGFTRRVLFSLCGFKNNSTIRFSIEFTTTFVYYILV